VATSQPFHETPVYTYIIRENRLEPITHIIEQCKSNNHKYQKIVYDRYRGFALKIVFRYIYHYDKAVDVVNDGFVKLFRNFSKFTLAADGNIEQQLMGYLKIILVNTAIDELRKGRMVPEIGGIPESVWEIKDNSENAEQLLFYKELITLIKELPPAYRIVFNMYVIDGFTHREISSVLNISEGTSKSNLSRAREILKKQLKHAEEEVLCRI
jgi:RNA polymerase sigma factor (sigma-70 family)